MSFVYKIRQKETGLFSSGGTSPEFNKLGKVWKTKGHLNSHLKQYTYVKIDYGYHDFLNVPLTKWYVDQKCEIVKFELKETEVEIIDF